MRFICSDPRLLEEVGDLVLTYHLGLLYVPQLKGQSDAAIDFRSFVGDRLRHHEL